MLASLMMIFQKDGSQVLEKEGPVWVIKQVRGLLKRFPSQRGREIICSYEFSKVKTPRKVKGGTSG